MCLSCIYHSKAGFDIHLTKKHSVAYALPDQLKVALFCLNNGFFKCDNSRKMFKCIKNEAFSVKQDFVPNDRISVFEKGKGKCEKHLIVVCMNTPLREETCLLQEIEKMLVVLRWQN